MKATAIHALLLLLLLSAGSARADFAGGDGSAADPWQVATAEQLDAIRNDLNDHYILTADIDLGRATGRPSGAFWNGGAGWEPIGSTLGDSFIGSLDGNGFTITGLFIDRTGQEQAGLFGWISFGAELTGLTLEAVDISGDSLVGGLVVTNFGGTIENSTVTGSVSGDELVGGLVARNLSGKVVNSHVTGSVTGSEKVGDLVGINWSTVTGSDADTGGTGESPASPGNSAAHAFPGTVKVTGTGVFNGVQVSGSIDSIRLPDKFAPPGSGVNVANGVLTLLGDDARATLLPHGVEQAPAGQEEGVFHNEDGDVVLVTTDRREVVSHPVVADAAALEEALKAFGLELQYVNGATMRLLPADDLSANADYFSARADMLAVPATAADQEGLFFREVPGLSRTSVAYLVFRDENGAPMQQELAPVPADWSAVKSALAATAGISDVRMDPQGIISVVVGDQKVLGRMEYEVTSSSAAGSGKPGKGVTLSSAGDVNDDGVEDFRVLYPNGDSQLLMIFP